MLFQGKAFKLSQSDQLAILDFDLEGEKVNKLSYLSATELDEIVTKFFGPGHAFRAVLIRSAKKNSFIVGADINLIKKLKDEKEAFEASQQGQRIFSRIEDLEIPTMVAIDGPCMGGGTELSLACRYRVCSDADKTAIGVPEVKLGLLPGWGGTYRLPKLVGLPNALDMILTGKSIRAKKAEKMGLVDAVIPSAIFKEKSLEIAQNLAKGEKFPNKKERPIPLQEKLLTRTALGRLIIFQQAKKGVLKATRGHYPSPLASLDLIQKNLGAKREKYLHEESRHFAKLWASIESKNLVRLFFLMEEAKKNTGTSLSEEQVKKLPPIKELGILGAGVMGGGIAAQAATYGVVCTLKDLNMDAVGKALSHAQALFQKLVKKKRLDKIEAENRMNRIRGQLSFEGFTALDLVIEAIVERIDVKKKAFTELETKVGPQTILASNTSSLSVTEMAKAVKDPSRFVGIHFFNPVDKMPLVEVITHDKVAPEVVARAVAFSKAIGKTPVVVKDGAGFLVNRLLMPWLNEACYCLLDGYRMETLDRVAKKFGMPMGPCELLDEVGLDVAGHVSQILFEAFGERAKPASVNEKIMADNKAQPNGGKARLGRKSGLGFYTWDKPGGYKEKPDQSYLDKILFAGNPPREPEYTDESLSRRMFFPMINEAAMTLEEGIVESPDMLDLAMIFGTGFPPFKGGLLRYADQMGPTKVVAELERMAELFGERMKPSAALKKYAAKGNFYPA